MTNHEIEDNLVWREITWPRPLAMGAIESVTRQVASSRLPGQLVWEVRGQAGKVKHTVATNKEQARRFGYLMHQLIPGISLADPDTRERVSKAGSLRIGPVALPANLDDSETVIRSLLAALAAARFPGDLVVLQIVVGDGQSPRFFNPGTDTPRSWWHSLSGRTAPTPTMMQSRMITKAADHSVRVTIRIGVAADTSAKRQALALGILEAIGTMEGPGVHAGLVRESPHKVNGALTPWLHWRLFKVPGEIGSCCS